MKQIIVWMVSANELLIRENRLVIEAKTTLADTNENTKSFQELHKAVVICMLSMYNICIR
jgi:hypothetical protein